MRKFLLLTAFVLLPAVLSARERPDTLLLDPLYLDTVTVTVPPVNDYASLGVQYGVSFSRMNLNTAQKQDYLIAPEYWSLLYTRYERMFDYLPYFGYQFGIEFGHAGTVMHVNEETGSVPLLDDATKIDMKVVDIPFMALLHYDVGNFQLSANAGVYGGYRMSIVRESPYLAEQYLTNFRDYENRFDYGLRGGLGLALIFDPIEFHVNAGVRYSWSEFQRPDYYSSYYYRFAYPYDIIVSAGISVQLVRRRGRTSAQLRKEAKAYVYGE